MRHETAIFGTKTQIQKFQLLFFFAFSLLLKQQKHKHVMKPLFYSVLADIKKRI